MKATPLFLSLSLALSAGCRGDDGGDGDGNGNGNGGADAGGGGEDVTIQEVQSDDMAVGTPVTLRGVVVVAIDAFGARTGSVYVQEPEGGAYSGVLVFVPGTAAADLVPGDLVDIENGVKDEFALAEDETGRTLTEVSPAEGSMLTINKVGDGAIPAPEVVNPWDLAASDEEAEKWEGVLVTFDNVRVLSGPRNVSSTDDTLNEMEVTGPFRVGSSLTALNPETINYGDCYQSITGIGDYFFNYKILPRNQADLVGAGENCLPEETSAELCGDGKDNDYNGFADCGDYSCDAPTGDEAMCEVATNVVAIQDESFDRESGRAVLTNVKVTAVSMYSIWVQDGSDPAPYNGLQVYLGEVPGAIGVGSTVDLKGRIIEYGSVTEMTEAEAGMVTGGAQPTPMAMSVADLIGADAEKYEGVLVSVENLTVKQAAGADTHGQFLTNVGADELWIDDLIYADAEDGVSASDCLSIDGVMHYNSADDPEHVTLLPRDADDIAAGGGC